MFRRFVRPVRRVRAITDIAFGELWERGFQALVIDLDNTLVGYKLLEPTPEVAAWIRGAQAAGFSIAIVSNNVRAWVSSIATNLSIVTYVHRAFKPLPFGIVRAVRQLRVTRDKVVVIGDQLFTDILAAKLVGVAAILTDPIVAHEPRAMWLVRLAERFALMGDERSAPKP
jgi:uncharacterized protein